MKTIPAVLIALLLFALPNSALAQNGLDGLSLGNFKMGSHVTGPAISGDDLRGRVVVIEYWGITCGPCLAAIPHTTELAAKYGHDKLIIIGNQVWGASDKQCKETWLKRAKNDGVVVTNRGSLKNFNPNSVPSAVIFDHTGKAIWTGHPGGMDRPLAQAIANAPKRAAGGADGHGVAAEPIIKGIEAKFFEDEVQQINEQTRSIDASLSRIRRAIQRPTNQEKTDEAQALLDAVAAWADEQANRANADIEKDPATAYATIETVIDLLGKDELAAGPAKVKQQMEADDKLMDRVRSTRMLREVVALAEQIGLTKDPAAAEDPANRREARAIARDLRRIAKNWPETEAGRKAAELQAAWKLSE